MRVTITCNAYATPDTCNDDARKKVLRTYNVVINARTLDVSSTIEPSASPTTAGLPGSSQTAATPML